jgi:hypothetical protein
MFRKAATLAIGLAVALSAETVVKGVKIRFNRSDHDRRLVDKSVNLTFDDKAHQLIAKGLEKEVTIAYGDVRKVVFDVTTHMRGGAVGELVDLVPFTGAVAGNMIQAKHVNDYWFYIETTSGPYTVLEIPRESSPMVIDKAKAVFGDKVSEYPTRQGEKIEKDTLQDLESKHSLRDDKKQHPIPELKLDKALVVVVCPPLAARDSGHGNQYKLHANDKVVAVNKPGTYSFAYLDPGEYLLASQAENASGLKLTVEAGKDYYFLQNTFMGVFKARTSLSQQSKEIVLHEMSGAGYADWKRK